MSWFLLLPAAVIAAYLINTWLKDKNKGLLPPGPPFLESVKIVVGCILNDDLPMVGEKLAKKYGEIFNIRLFGDNMVFLNSSRLIRKVLTTHAFRDVTNDRPSSFLRDYLFSGGKDIGFSDSNEYLYKLRKLVHGVVRLYGTGVSQFEDMVNTEISVLEAKMLKSASRDKFDMDKALTVSIIRMFHVFLTNERLEDSDEVCDIVEEFNRAFNQAVNVDKNLILSLFPWLKYFPCKAGKIVTDLDKHQKRLKDYFLDSTKKQRLKGNGSMLGTLYEEQDNDPNLTDVMLKGVLFDMIAGGFITTKGALSGIFLMLMHYPEVQHKIQEELDEKLGNRTPSQEDRPELHYTNAAILECFRYIRHIPLGIPHRNKETIEIEGYSIPANSTLVTNLWVTNRGEFWENPDKMCPERFLDNDGKLVPSDHPLRYQMIPFGVGKRVCVGETFAKTRIFLYVTRLLQKFEFLKGDNKLVSDDSSTWTASAAFYPQFLNCKIVNRKSNVN